MKWWYCIKPNCDYCLHLSPTCILLSSIGMIFGLITRPKWGFHRNSSQMNLKCTLSNLVKFNNFEIAYCSKQIVWLQETWSFQLLWNQCNFRTESKLLFVAKSDPFISNKQCCLYTRKFIKILIHHIINVYQYLIYRTNLSSMYSVDDAATRCYTRVQYFSYCDSSDGNLEQF